jgi:hypothetical protein
MKKEKMVDYVEIWETEGKSPFKVGKKLLCILVNNYPVYIVEDILCEIRKEKEEIAKNKKLIYKKVIFEPRLSN